MLRTVRVFLEVTVYRESDQLSEDGGIGSTNLCGLEGVVGPEVVENA